MKSAVRVAALVAVAGALCTSQAAFAEDSAKSPAPPASNALRVVVDPQTGELRAPTPEEIRAQVARENAAAASARSARAAAAPTTSAVLPTEKSVTRHKSGMVSVKLSQDSLSMLKATTDTSGKTVVKHDSEVAQPIATEE
jgi:hypothetical protein